MEKRLSKTIYVENEEFEIDLIVDKNKDNYRFENITVVITRYNGERMQFVNIVSAFSISEEDRYIKAIKETIELFKSDVSIVNFLEWNGDI